MTEYWLSGPIAGVPPLLQPVAHALSQARDEVNAVMAEFPAELLWERPAGVASVAFHLQHLAGVLDRLFTYSKGLALSEEQFQYLKNEGEKSAITKDELVRHFNRQVTNALLHLIVTDPNSLTDFRPVGRNRLPSTVIGLLTHAAEHTMRHTGQLMVTAKILCHK